MKNYVKIDGKERRFETNFNAIGKALSLLGKDDLNGLVDVSQIHVSELPVIFSCALNEGARLDGDDWRLSPEDAGSLPIPLITEMINVYVKQLAGDQKTGDTKKDAGAEK